MAELPLLDLDFVSEHSNTATSRTRKSALHSWGSGRQKGDKTVVIESGRSNSSSDGTSHGDQQVQNIQETNFGRKIKSKVSTKDEEAILSSTSSPSSGADDIYSPFKKSGEKSRPTPAMRTNKIADVKVQEESRRIRISQENEQRNQTKMFRLKKQREQRRFSGGDSVDEVEPGRSYTPMSDTVSYRERIRDRFNTVKERAVESLSRPQSRSQSRLKQLLNKPVTSRIDDLLKQEEDELAASLQKHEEIKKRWRQYSHESVHDAVPYEEGYQFFTNHVAHGDQQANEDFDHGTEDEEVFVDAEEEAVVVDEVDENGGTEDDAGSSLRSQQSPPTARIMKMTTAEYLGFKEDWDLTEMVRPQQNEPSHRFLARDVFFVPSTAPVSKENKLEPGLAPRRLEDEGLYVGNRLTVPDRMRNKMENRVLMTPESSKWFSTDGELVAGANPLKSMSMRLVVDEESRSQLELEYRAATVSELQQQYMELGNYVLDIDVGSVDFTHHPLYSVEHALVRRLTDLLLKHKTRLAQDEAGKLEGRLRALRRARKGLDLSDDDVSNKAKIKRCEADIKEARELWHWEGLANKLLINKILSTWKDVKRLREKQGYQNTGMKVSIKKLEPEGGGAEEEEERRRWQEDINNEVEELLRERNKLKDQNQDEKSTRSEDSGGSSTAAVFRDENTVREEVKTRFKRSFRQPGEARIVVSMSVTPLPDTTINNREEPRWTAMKKTRVFVKLVYNGKEVCRSDVQPLTNKFSVLVGQRFAIRILEWPESLVLEVHQDSGGLLKSQLIAEIFLPFPDSYTTMANWTLCQHEFSSTQVVSYNHTGVGSGSFFTLCPDGSEFNNQPVCLFTSGTVSCRLGWAVDKKGHILAPPDKYWTHKREETNLGLLDAFGAGKKLDINKLRSWVEHSGLDPNDPLNASFFYLVQRLGDVVRSEPDYLRLDPLCDMTTTQLCSDKDLDDNPRLRMLRLRDQGEPEFRDLTMVPLNLKQIPTDLFKLYEKRVSSVGCGQDVNVADPLDRHRAWGRKYLEQVQQQVLQQYRLAKQHRRLQDVVIEEHVPDIGTLGMTFMKWLRPRRPLRPVRKERRKVAVQTLSGHDLTVVVNVVRAFEVPVRKDTETNGASGDGFSLVNVRPLVEVSFRGVTVRTTPAEGANPTWNQDLYIPLGDVGDSGDFSKGSVQSLKDARLYLQLMDEVVTDVLVDDSMRETDIHQRLERHWLGGLEIPFSTLFSNSRIEGTFKLYSPPVLLGYEREAHRRQVGGDDQLTQRDATYLTLYITVQPALHPPEPIKEKLASGEVAGVESHLDAWQAHVSSLFPHRKVKGLIVDVTGKSVCITRFVRPLEPPVLVEGADTTADMAARFVAMIPTVSGTTLFPGLFEIWLTSDQVVHLLTGASEDHALLLCCYLLHLGMKAYVLLGSGIPRGYTAYVLVREGFAKHEYTVWDPINGQKYTTTDSFCPLQKIFCVFNQDNIWANIQAEERPRRVRFDVSKSSDWLPVFGRNLSAPSNSLQPEVIEYRPTNRQAVEVLQDRMEKRLRDSLMKWRKRSRTQWNRYCVATLRKLLPRLEEACWRQSDIMQDHAAELQPILMSHKVCGFPINMPYTSVESVMDAVRATGVHCNETEDVEFALAVYIHPYPNDVLSVWVYVASLIRQR